jgi:hypothetical protein
MMSRIPAQPSHGRRSLGHTQGLTPSAAWPGLVFSRYEQRGAPSWEEVGSPALCLVAQGRQRIRIGSVNYFADPFHALVMTRGLRFQTEILQASLPRPFLSFTLQVSPELVAEIAETMKQSAPALFHIEPAPPLPDGYVTTLDQQFLGAVRRFLLALESDAERGVLAPLYLREIVYRLLRSEQRVRLLASAVSVSQSNAITAAMAFMKLELHRPLSVWELAEAVKMSESRFAHVWKRGDGRGPAAVPPTAADGARTHTPLERIHGERGSSQGWLRQPVALHSRLQPTRRGAA